MQFSKDGLEKDLVETEARARLCSAADVSPVVALRRVRK
jgi:hypothetical protein